MKRMLLGAAALCLQGMLMAQNPVTPVMAIDESEKNDYYNVLVYSPDGKWLATATDRGYVKVWKSATGEKVYEVEAHANDCYAIAFSRDSRFIATGSWDKSAAVYSLESGTRICRFEHPDFVNALAFTPDGKFLVAGDSEDEYIVWNIRQQKEVKKLSDPAGHVWSMAFSPNGKGFVASFRNRIVVYTSRFKKLKELNGHEKVVYATCYSPDGKYLYSAGEDKEILQWELKSGKIQQRFPGHKEWIGGLSVSPDGNYLCSASADGSFKLWNTGTGRMEYEYLEGDETVYRSCCFSPDGNSLSVLRSNGVIHTFRLTDLIR